MTVQGFSYESVFRYLRCGMSDLSRREVDILENYVIALGIRGFRKWNETWVRIYRGMDPAVIMDLNEIREHFTEEVRELAFPEQHADTQQMDSSIPNVFHPQKKEFPLHQTHVWQCFHIPPNFP